MFNIAFGKSISLKKLLSNILQYFKKKIKKSNLTFDMNKHQKKILLCLKFLLQKQKKKLNYLPRTNIKKGLYLSF